MGKQMNGGLSRAEIAKIAAEIGAKAALEELEKEKKKTRDSWYSRKLRNTKLLLQNYRMFKLHADNAIFDVESMREEESAIEILELMMDGSADRNLFVESIKTSVARTQIIVTHITEMLKLYSVYCTQSPKPEDRRRYNVVYSMYIDEDSNMTVADIAEAEGIDSRTVYKDIDAAVEKISALIFGIDGIKGHY